ncbi:MAG: T9SS type A sorting domain-containing protein, partial [Segetibacter sp.]|nr:T9SS type A sorting domain-containing protein [Segetibacter sp.]
GVSTNGFLSFGSSTATPANAGSTNSLSTGPFGASFLRPIIAPLWDDLDIQSVDSLQYAVSGSAPNRVFTMQWSNVKWPALASAPSISFQAKLFEGSNIIQFVYQLKPPPPGNNPFPSASIGITSAATGPSNFISLQNTTAFPTISRIIENTNLREGPAFGQVYTFTPAIINNDAVLTNVYTLAKIATSSDNPNVVSASITNISGTPFTDLNVTLKVTGATNFTNTKVIPFLNSGGSVVVTFDGYTASTTGNNIVNVSIPADNDNTNNSLSLPQTVTTNRWGYAYTTAPTSGFGFAPGTTGDLAAKFKNVGSTIINQVTLYFSGGGQPFQATIWDASGTGGRPGTLLWSSPTSTSAAGPVNIDVSPNVTVNGDFFVGVRQIGTSNVLMGFETENPLRSGTFFTMSSSSGNWFDLYPSGFFRFMFEAQFVSTLPITTTALKGERKDSKNLLSWTTLTEQNNKGFEIQRSADGSNFSSIGFVMSKAINGNSTTNIDYQFEDTKPFAANGYYRVMQIDKDGKLMYSNAVLLKGLKRGDVTLSVYPNPVKSILNMVITAPENNKATLTITDALARTVMQKTEQLLSGDNNVSINVAGLATGSYTIKAFYADRQTVVKKFVKQ